MSNSTAPKRAAEIDTAPAFNQAALFFGSEASASLCRSLANGAKAPFPIGFKTV